MCILLDGNDQAFSDLERHARGRCVIFHDQPLPDSARPPRARIGFEIDPATGAATLLVDRGVTYAGPTPSVREWLQAGQKTFPSFQDFRQWLREHLAAAYRQGPGDTAPGTPANRIPPPPGVLTDLDQVRSRMSGQARTTEVDESALFQGLSSHVRGQESALRALSRGLKRHLARPHPRRPATFLALGPTGTGKTKTAETLRQVLRAADPEGAGYNFLRLDMNEYSESHRVSQLLGAPQGYIGYGEGAQLPDALSANPRTVVLFDEIEKANGAVWKTLMNAMDAGRLSAPSRSSGSREIDCRQAVFLFTSNIEAGGILKELSERDAFGHPGVVDEVCRRRLSTAGVPSDLISRIGSFLVYRPLGEDSQAEIAVLAATAVAREYGLTVERVDSELVLAILNRARAKEFGARPYEYAVDDLLGDAFATAAAARLRGPVVVKAGPPPACKLLDPANDAPAAAAPQAVGSNP